MRSALAVRGQVSNKPKQVLSNDTRPRATGVRFTADAQRAWAWFTFEDAGGDWRASDVARMFRSTEVAMNDRAGLADAASLHYEFVVAPGVLDDAKAV